MRTKYTYVRIIIYATETILARVIKNGVDEGDTNFTYADAIEGKRRMARESRVEKNARAGYECAKQRQKTET